MAKGKRGFQPGNTIGKSFSSNYQPKKNGRKRALYTKILQNLSKKEESELSKEDYFKIIRTLMECTPAHLKRILEKSQNDEKDATPMWMLNIISAIFSDIKKGQINFLKFFLDRILGKSEIHVEIKNQFHQVNQINIKNTNLIEEEIKQLDEILSKISKGNSK